MTDHPTEQSPVTIRCRENLDVELTLRDPYHPDDDGVFLTVQAQADGLQVHTSVELWVSDSRDFPGFLDQLAVDFRGWEGERVWRTMADDFKVRATFHSYGHVRLTWTLGRRAWETSVTTWLEAGEQMAALSADVRHLLR